MDNQGHSIDKCPLRKKIEKNDDRSKDNKRKIEQITKGDWYSNQQLFEMIQDLTSHLTEFNGKFDKYNGLIEKYQNHEDRLDKIEESKTEETGKKKAKDRLMDNIAWIIAVVSSAATFVLTMAQLGVI